MAKNAFTRTDDGTDDMFSRGIIALALLLFVINFFIIVPVMSGIIDMLFVKVPPDVWTGVLFMMCAVAAAGVIDAPALIKMFFDVGSKPDYNPAVEVSNTGKSTPRQSPSSYMVILNWTASVGVASVALKLSLINPVKNSEMIMSPSPKLAHDLFSGELQLNSLLRQGSGMHWETYYGHVCVFYLVMSFLTASARRADFAPDLHRYVQKGAMYMVLVLVLGGLGGYLASSARFFTCTVFLMHGLLPSLFGMVRRAKTAATGYAEPLTHLAGVEEVVASACITFVVASGLVAGLKSLPGAVDSDFDMVQHADPTKGIHLQFCEEPYYYFSWAAQGVALIFHMPYAPVFLSIFYWRRLSIDMRWLLTFQLFFQLWTGYGHYLPDPRVFKVAEGSIMMAGLYNLQFLKMTSNFPKSFAVWKVAVVYIPVSLAIYCAFGLLTNILGQALFFPIFAYLFPAAYADIQLAAKLSSRVKVMGVVQLLIATSIIITEATFCQTLLTKLPLPYHSFFDVGFFQILANFMLYIAIDLKESSQHTKMA